MVHHPGSSYGASVILPSRNGFAETPRCTVQNHRWEDVEAIRLLPQMVGELLKLQKILGERKRFLKDLCQDVICTGGRNWTRTRTN